MNNSPTIATVGLEDTRAALAAELGAKLMPVSDVLDRHNISREQLKVLMADMGFRSMVRQFRRDWSKAENARERIRMKAQLAVEDGLVEVYRLFNDEAKPVTARLDAYKQLVNLADVSPKQNEVGQLGPTFALTLNMGPDDSKQLTIEAAPLSNSHNMPAEDT